MNKKAARRIVLLCTLVLVLSGCKTGRSGSQNPDESASAEEFSQPVLSVPDPASILLSGQETSPKVRLSYQFSGDDAAKAGYAEGLLSLSSSETASYHLYWSDDSGALSGYYEIVSLDVEAGSTCEFSFDYHTAIPADATKVIAVEESKVSEYPAFADAAAFLEIPSEKRLGFSSSDALYTFNSFSDIHIDEEHFGETPAYRWSYSEAHFAQALDYAASLGVDFIISSGDQVTNSNFANLDKEWKAYQLILSQSDYVNPIYESGGNHEVRQDHVIKEELRAFIIASGLDSSMDTLAAAAPYYSITEPHTGDLFIFMSFDGGFHPEQRDIFTDSQLAWVENLLLENYGKGKNIYLIQHALIRQYGPGDDPETPYYHGSLNPETESVRRFISLLEEYKDIIWISGHSHETFALGYNYSNHNGTSCNMIHNPSIANPTHVTDGAIDYTPDENLSQGYYVQVFESAIIFSGANICDQKIYPAYSYIIDGRTSPSAREPEADILDTDISVTDDALRSVLANVNTVLGIYYEFSSYDQYQTLKKYYYQYKDADTAAMSREELLTAYSRLRLSIASLHQIVEFINGSG